MEEPRIEVISRERAAFLASKTPQERIAMMVEMNRSARLLLAAGARYRHPEWSEKEVQEEVARLMLHGSV